jgi:hypothetical protein
MNLLFLVAILLQKFSIAGKKKKIMLHICKYPQIGTLDE